MKPQEVARLKIILILLLPVLNIVSHIIIFLSLKSVNNEPVFNESIIIQHFYLNESYNKTLLHYIFAITIILINFIITLIRYNQLKLTLLNINDEREYIKWIYINKLLLFSGLLWFITSIACIKFNLIGGGVLLNFIHFINIISYYILNNCFILKEYIIYKNGFLLCIFIISLILTFIGFICFFIVQISYINMKSYFLDNITYEIINKNKNNLLIYSEWIIMISFVIYQFVFILLFVIFYLYNYSIKNEYYKIKNKNKNDNDLYDDDVIVTDDEMDDDNTNKKETSTLKNRQDCELSPLSHNDNDDPNNLFEEQKLQIKSVDLGYIQDKQQK